MMNLLHNRSKRREICGKKDQLAADEVEVDKNLAIANGLLMDGTAWLSAAVNSNNMSEIQAASALVECANEKIKNVNTHRKSLMDAIIIATKKKKK